MTFRTLALAAAISGCGGELRTGGTLAIALDTATDARRAAIVLNGVSSADLRALRESARDETGWQKLLRVDVAGANVPVAGTYTVGDTAIEFRPRFMMDRGRSYLVSVDPSQLPSARTDVALTKLIALPAGDRTPRTFVTNLYPTSDTVPENLLRLYVEFNAPMSRTGGLEYVKLLDDRGKQVKAAFLPLEADFWNFERTRYTLFLDPGRVKQGIRPNEELGRALLPGRRYAIVVDSTWQDGNGLPLAKSFRREFVVGPADETVIDISKWKIEAPTQGTTEPLVVRFPDAIDRGLLMRSLRIETVKSRLATHVDGDIAVDRGERAWRLTPKERWRRGDYQLAIYTILEDPSGNQIDKKFEVDMFDRVDKSAAPERRTLPFVVR